jgi:ribonuclease BN (tRNA processing enzyme)
VKDNGLMNIRILGAHSCESKNMKCISILVDDRLVIDAGGLTSSLSISEQQKLEAILLTHPHYDHIRDIPMIAINLYRQGSHIQVYAAPDVRDFIETKFLDGKLYPKFHEVPEESPTVSFNPIAPYDSQRINGYSVLAVPVHHIGSTVGYQVSNADGKTIFYTADTGPGLVDCWEHVSPDLIIAEVTVSNNYRKFAINTGHLTPSLLKEELIKFRELKGYLPQVVVVHMDPVLEKEIREEIAVVAEALDLPITVAYEGMQISL